VIDKYDLVVSGGLVVGPGGPRPADVAIRGSRFAYIGDVPDESAAEVVDATGCHVFPGAIDAHVHLGLTIAGHRSGDDHETGSLAAVCGGVTTVGDFTVQAPGEGLLDSIEHRIRAASGGTWCDWFLHANITSPSREVLDEIPAAIESGTTSFKLFLAYPEMMVDRETLGDVLSRVGASGGLVMVHAEDQPMIDDTVRALVDSGRIDAPHFFGSRPPEAEAGAIRAVGRMALQTGQPVYIVHMSSRQGLEAAMESRDRGATIHLETCPQYLRLTNAPNPLLRHEHLVCSPPLRDRADVDAMRESLANGVIDVLATDHCPFKRAQKEASRLDFRGIPGGLPGVETLVPLGYDMALNGVIDPGRLASVLSSTPARLFGLSDTKGVIREGLDADLLILDPSGRTVVTAGDMHSDTDYSPYEGMRLRGELRSVYLRGRCVARRDADGRMRPVGEKAGRYVRASTVHSLQSTERAQRP